MTDTRAIDEAAVLKLCKSGELVAFAALYDAYIQKIYSYIFFRIRHRQIAEDLASQTFVKALEYIASFDSEKGSFSAWLYRIARNTVFDYYRTSHPSGSLDETSDVPSQSDTQREVAGRLELERAEAFLKQLPSELRDLVIMRVWDGLSYAEISEVTGKTEAACKMSVSRSLARIQKYMYVAAAIIFINLGIKYFV